MTVHIAPPCFRLCVCLWGSCSECSAMPGQAVLLDPKGQKKGNFSFILYIHGAELDVPMS